MYNDLTGQIEEVHNPQVNGHGAGQLNGGGGGGRDEMGSARKALRTAPSSLGSVSSGGRGRLQKSYSTESSLNHLVPSSPIHPPRSREASPSKNGRRPSPRKSRTAAAAAAAPTATESGTTENEKPMTNGHHTEEEEGVNGDAVRKVNGTSDEQGQEAAEELSLITIDHSNTPQTINGHFSRKSNPDIPETIPE